VKKKVPQFPLPEPIELAKLAAILGRHVQPSAALNVAMQYYVEAVLFCQECSSMDPDDLIRKFGSDKRWLEVAAAPVKKAVRARWADTLELDPQKDDDAARQFLADSGLPRKTGKAVLNNIRDAVKARPNDTLLAQHRETPDVLIARCKTVSNGRTIYNIPKFLLQEAADHADWRRRKSKRKAWNTRKSRETTVRKTGKKNLRKSSVEPCDQ
jgi:hypothetical protein